MDEAVGTHVDKGGTSSRVTWVVFEGIFCLKWRRRDGQGMSGAIGDGGDGGLSKSTYESVDKVLFMWLCLLKKQKPSVILF